MEIKTEFNIGEKVFVAFKDHEVTFNDNLPVVEMVVEGIRFNGSADEDSLNVDIYYCLREVGGFATAREPAANIFKSEQDAKIKAKHQLLKQRDNTKARLDDIDAMLEAHQKQAENSHE